MILLLWAYSGGANTIVRIYTSPDKVQKMPLKGVDIVGFSSKGEWTDVAVDERELEFIQSLGIKSEVIIEDVREHSYRVMGSYRTTSQVFSDLVNYASTYPTITKLDTLAITYEGRPIMILRITDNPTADEGEPAVLITGLHHAREWPTVEITMFFIDTLLRGYGTDPEITDFINNLDIYVVPLVNPDGYYYSHDLGNTMWRKNRRYFPEFGSYGVDLNRNYLGSSNTDPRGSHCTPTAGTTNYPSDDVYCGPLAFSEAEIAGIRAFVESHPNIVAAINYHTYSGVVLYPWGYTSSSAPDAFLLYALADSMASQMVTENNNPYSAVQAPDIGYTATGDSDDWEYGWSIFSSGYPMIAFTVEACEQFQPPTSQLDQIVRENWKGMKALLRNAPSIRSNLVAAVIVESLAVSDTVDTAFSADIVLKSPYMAPLRFALRYFTDYSVVEDGAEISDDLWEMDGFSRTNARSHTGSYSFSASYDNRAAYHITSIYPYLVRSGDSLTFWTWYDIETNYDAAFVEVSTDRQAFYPLDKITGNSGGWIRKAYSLEDWVGKWVYFRFRFVSDAYVTGDGFFIDDINPVPSFSGETVVDTALPSSTFSVTLPTGTYYLQVKGYNTAKGWGEWSSPKKVTVLAVSVAERSVEKRRIDAVYTPDGRYVGKNIPTTKGIYFVREGNRIRKVLVK
ncbi:MAG: hypothetical protein GXO39_01425 [Thermotogae bacterium]|nr:hypothetical protein [Thermotogota bacterium]